MYGLHRIIHRLSDNVTDLLSQYDPDGTTEDLDGPFKDLIAFVDEDESNQTSNKEKASSTSSKSSSTTNIIADDISKQNDSQSDVDVSTECKVAQQKSLPKLPSPVKLGDARSSNQLEAVVVERKSRADVINDAARQLLDRVRLIADDLSKESSEERDQVIFFVVVVAFVFIFFFKKKRSF